jgi:hypothetical protein
MKVYEVTIQRPWDGKETISIHMTRKGALQVACAEGLEVLLGVFDQNDEDLTWAEENLETLLNPDHTLKIKDLDELFNKCAEFLWSVEMELEVLEYTLKP